LIVVDGPKLALPRLNCQAVMRVELLDRVDAGLAALEQVAHDPRLTRSNLVPSVRADLLRRAGRPVEAAHWYRAALELNGAAPGRDFLRRRIAECGGGSGADPSRPAR
jgi:RNA polymerase sigma-70 factor (ECF subfamily)